MKNITLLDANQQQFLVQALDIEDSTYTAKLSISNQRITLNKAIVEQIHNILGNVEERYYNRLFCEFHLTECTLPNLEGLQYLFQVLKFKTYNLINLSMNNLAALGGAKILTAGSKSWKAEALDLSNNNFSGDDVPYLKEIILNSPLLKKLDLRGNHSLFNTGGVTSLIELMSCANNLTELNITGALGAYFFQNDESFVQALNERPNLTVVAGSAKFKAQPAVVAKPVVAAKPVPATQYVNQDTYLVTVKNQQGDQLRIELYNEPAMVKAVIRNQTIQADDVLNDQLATVLSNPRNFNPSCTRDVTHLQITSCNIINNQYTGTLFRYLTLYPLVILDLSNNNFGDNECLAHLASERWLAKKINLSQNNFSSKNHKYLWTFFSKINGQEVDLSNNPNLISTSQEYRELLTAGFRSSKINLKGSIKQGAFTRQEHAEIRVSIAPRMEIMFDEDYVFNPQAQSARPLWQNIPQWPSGHNPQSTQSLPSNVNPAPQVKPAVSPVVPIIYTIERNEIVIVNKSQLTQDHINQILDCVHEQQIFKLRIQSCKLTHNNPFIKSIVTLSSFKVFDSLDFKHNNLGAGEGVTFLLERLDKVYDLSQLALANNNLTDNDLMPLLNVSRMTKLITLDLSDNPRLNEKGRLLDCILTIECSQLRELNLLNCGLDVSQTTINKLQQIFNKNPNLTIYLDDTIKQALQFAAKPMPHWFTKAAKSDAMDVDAERELVRFKTMEGYTPFFKVNNQTLYLTSDKTLKFGTALVLINGIEKCIRAHEIKQIVVYKTTVDQQTLGVLFELLANKEAGLMKLIFDGCPITAKDIEAVHESLVFSSQSSAAKNFDLFSLKSKSFELYNWMTESNMQDVGKVAESIVKLLQACPLIFKTNSGIITIKAQQCMTTLINNQFQINDITSRITGGEPAFIDPNLAPVIIPNNMGAPSIHANAQVNSISGSVNSVNSVHSIPLNTQPMIVNYPQPATNTNDNANLPVITYQEKIGQGGFASVFKATYQGTTVAIKELSSLTAEAIQDFQVERELLSKLNHPNVLQIYTSFVGADQKPRLVMKYASHGSLYTFIQTSTYGQLDPAKRRELGKQIADGLAYLKEQKVIHGDIKSKNILVDENMGLQIADLGLARVVHTNTMSRTNTRGGGMTPQWSAIEILTNPQAKNTHETDVYSMGVVFWEMLTCRIPFKDYSTIFNLMAYYFSLQGEIFASGKELSLPDNADPKFADVMRCCLFRDPSKRITAADASAKLAAEPEICELEFFSATGIIRIEL